MKKHEYWQQLRSKMAHTYSDDGSSLVEVNDTGLAEYAYAFWLETGALPADYLPIEGKEKPEGQFLRCLWEITERDPAFQPIVLDAYEEHYLEQCRDKSSAWYSIRVNSPGAFTSGVVAPQLRTIAQQAIKISTGYTGKDAKGVTGLLFLCLEEIRVRHEANKDDEGSQARALHKNANLMSLISEHTSWSWEQTTEVLERLPGHLNTEPSVTKPTFEQGMTTFDEFIRPVLIGRLMSEAKTFAAWQKILYFAKDRDSKVLALYHMSSKAKTLKQFAAVYYAACENKLVTLQHSSQNSWKTICISMSAEELNKLEPDEILMPKFTQELILSKCED
jgi:hypothetical protein